jgi:exonuclease SbcC
MRFRKLKLKNIRSYANEEIIFPDGSLLLAGDVGSGKTSILLAIEYAIFGLQPGQKGSALLRSDSDTAEVVLELEVDGDEIIIERKLKRTEKTISNDYSAITINGEKLELSTTELKTKIIELLHYPKEFIKKTNLLYRYTVFTPQEQMKQIILEDSELRLNVIRHVFGVDKYKRIRENLQVLLIYLKENAKIIQGEIKSLDEDKVRVESTKSFIKVLDDKILQKGIELLENLRKRREIELEIESLEVKIKEKENLEKEVDKTKWAISSKTENLSSISKEIKEITKNIEEIKEVFDIKKFNELNIELEFKKADLEKLNYALIEISSQISSLEQSKNDNLLKKERVFSIDICPTCLQDVPQAHKHNILNSTESFLVEINKKIEKYEKERIALRENIDKHKFEITKIEKQRLSLEILKSKSEYLEKSKKKLFEITKQKESLEKDILLLSKHLDVLKEDILKFSTFSNHYKIKQDELKLAFQKEKNSEISLAELKKELEITNKEITLLQKTIKQKEKSKEKLASILELSDWFSTHFINLIDFTERNVLMRLRMEFSKLFNKWFHMLAGETFEVQLDENFTPLITQGEFEMDYSFLSGGERTAIALAYRLALNQTINSVISEIKTKEIVILDEPTEGFSEAQISKIRDVLEELNAQQLIIVSHEQKIEGFIDNILRVKKHSNSSSITTEEVTESQQTLNL